MSRAEQAAPEATFRVALPEERGLEMPKPDEVWEHRDSGARVVVMEVGKANVYGRVDGSDLHVSLYNWRQNYERITEPVYPCKDCGDLRTEAEGGTTFSVCDECWDKRREVTREVEVPDCQADVRAFHEALVPDQVADTPTMPSERVRRLRLALIEEEVGELADALDWQGLVGIADAIADLLYVTYGTAVACGIDIAPIWREVHRSNMAKTGGPTREDGKILKPEGWIPPDVRGELVRQGWTDPTEQPRPRGTGRDITPLVIADLEARTRKGVATYGEPLRAHNGRSALVDLYEELLDAVQYIRQEIEERGNE